MYWKRFLSRSTEPLWIFMGINMGMGFKTDTLQITPDLLNLVAEIDEFKGA